MNIALWTRILDVTRLLHGNYIEIMYIEVKWTHISFKCICNCRYKYLYCISFVHLTLSYTLQTLARTPHYNTIWSALRLSALRIEMVGIIIIIIIIPFSYSWLWKIHHVFIECIRSKNERNFWSFWACNWDFPSRKNGLHMMC